MPDKYCIIMTTAASAADAERLTALLLKHKLAACIQHLPIKSFYVFEGEQCHEPEILLLLKTRAALYEQIEALFKTEHPYTVPEILQIPVNQGFAPYLSWLDANTAHTV